MPKDDDQIYDLDPTDEPPAPRRPPPDVEPGEDVAPLDIEPAPDASSSRSPSPSDQDVEDESDYVHGLDVCANCGAPMRGTDTLVCLRCGWDMRTGRIINVDTRTTEVEEEPEEEEADAAARSTPLSEPGRGDYYLPLTIGGLGLLAVIIASLAGAPSLFPALAIDEPPTFSDRMIDLVRTVLMIGLWTACGLGALAFVAAILKTSLGDLTLALARLGGIFCFVLLVEFLDLRIAGWELTFEVVLKLIGLGLLSMYFFRLTPHDAGILTVSTLIAFLMLWFVYWMMGLVFG